MTDQEAAELYAKLVAGKVKRPAGVFPRGFNAGVNFAIRLLLAIEPGIVQEPDQQ